MTTWLEPLRVLRRKRFSANGLIPGRIIGVTPAAVPRVGLGTHRSVLVRLLARPDAEVPSFADSAHDARGRSGADGVAAELLHDRLVVFRQRLHQLFRLHLNDLVAARLELSQKLWQRQ